MADERPRRARLYKGPDGETLDFTETADGNGFDVTIVGGEPTAPSATIRISKGEARTFGRFLQIRRSAATRRA